MSNSRYKDKNYWNKRYDGDEKVNTEWLCNYCDVKKFIDDNCDVTDSFLILGTGDSELSADLYEGGYPDITNVDYSDVVVEKMSQKYEKLDRMKWICEDIRNLAGRFSSTRFDVVLEKATIDSLLVDEIDSWHPSTETMATMNVILCNIYEILKENGVFISITFAQPHFRLPFLMSDQFRWSISVEKIGLNFHYFVYVMRKGRAKNDETLNKFLYPVAGKNSNNFNAKEIIFLDKNEDENFLHAISL